MIDLHCHILPGVDDGAASDADAISMLRIARADGIDRIVATPHIPPLTGKSLPPEEILRHVSGLNELACGLGVPVEILTGSEIRFEPDIVDALVSGDLLSLNGSPYVLIEFPLVGDLPDHMRETIYDVQMAGFMPVLAHVERYPAVQREPQILVELISTGVLMQVNAASALANPREPVGSTTRRLLSARMVHLIASDAHSPRSRPPRLSAAYQHVTESYGDDYASWIQQNSESVATGDTIFAPEPQLELQRSWWSRLWPGLKP